MENSGFYTISKTERDYITSLISNILNRDEEVVFAYLYGSFIGDGPFRDIDIFVYLRNGEDPFADAVRIKERVSDALANAGFNKFAVDDIDVRVINDSPYDFAIDLLSDGLLIVDKDAELRTDYIEQVSDEYRVNYFILDEAYGEGR
ncbi:MAG: nucleotidyltransferase domain-containing protein [Deltaproteobacteria bacterium]|nr:nucleotidyltransferase domain-containing protein [Deltaproteobacteria bacterium]